MPRQKPKHVLSAIHRGDRHALRKMGRKGGLKRAENIKRRKDEEDALQMLREEEAERGWDHLQREINANICPIN